MFLTFWYSRNSNHMVRHRICPVGPQCPEQETFKEELVQKIDSYMNYVAENWMKENELAIERGLRTEITEDFIKSFEGYQNKGYYATEAEKSAGIVTAGYDTTYLSLYVTLYLFVHLSLK